MMSVVGSASMFRVDPLQKFSFRAEERQKWCEEFRRFGSVSKLTEELGETQRESLLYIMDSESEKIFQNLEFRAVTVGEGDDAREVQEMDTDFDTLIREFDEYFVVKRNIIYKRTKFHERQPKEEEAAEEFYRSLRSLITRCQFRNVEEQVRDRFVAGLRDRKLKERLQLTLILTLTKALDIAR